MSLLQWHLLKLLKLFNSWFLFNKWGYSLNNINNVDRCHLAENINLCHLRSDFCNLPIPHYTPNERILLLHTYLYTFYLWMHEKNSQKLIWHELLITGKNTFIHVLVCYSFFLQNHNCHTQMISGECSHNFYAN